MLVLELERADKAKSGENEAKKKFVELHDDFKKEKDKLFSITYKIEH